MPRDENKVKNFVHRLGASQFDELLYAEIDEGIRNFINELLNVMDLRHGVIEKEACVGLNPFRNSLLKFTDKRGRVNSNPANIDTSLHF